MSRTIVALFAHPDDETFATGGTIARYASEGVRIALYCASDGDAGKSSGIPVSSRAELGRLRRAELRAAARILGIAALEFGGHPDGELGETDPEVVMAEMAALLRRERPDIVLTFGPEGAPTQHRDHRAISRLATAATLLAGTRTAFTHQLEGGSLSPHRTRRLCYVTWTPPAPDALYATEGQPVEILIDARPWLPRKREAFLAHVTQRQHQAAFEAAAFLDSEGYFVASGEPAPHGATDLFAGL